MSYKIANKVIADFMTSQADAALGGRPGQWVTSKYASLQEFIELFDSQADNDEWITLTKKFEGDLNKVIGARARIAWLCGMRSDLRRQFAAGSDHHVRNHVDIRRHSYLQQRNKHNALVHAETLLETERRKAITKGG